jgi:hypothetical protein
MQWMVDRNAPWIRRKRYDFHLGLAICIPIYGYVIYKLLGG